MNLRQLWALQDEPETVRESANVVLRGHRAGAPVYLRVTPRRHRAPEEVAAEVHWMTALANSGLPVVRPLPSINDGLIEPIAWRDEGASAICMSAAPGRPARKPGDFRPAVIEGWATLLAGLHRHAREFTGAPPAARQAWHQDRVYLVARQAHLPEVAAARAMLDQLTRWLHGLPTPVEAYGLTHADLHLSNLAVTGEGADANPVVTAFDFDDSCLHFFIHDVAVAVTSIRKAAWEYPGQVNAAALEQQFIEQHGKLASLPSPWSERLEAFIAYRLALSACWASRSAETGALEPEMLPWFQRSLPWWLGQLEERRPAITAAMSVR